MRVVARVAARSTQLGCLLLAVLVQAPWLVSTGAPYGSSAHSVPPTPPAASGNDQSTWAASTGAAGPAALMGETSGPDLVSQSLGASLGWPGRARALGVCDAAVPLPWLESTALNATRRFIGGAHRAGLALGGLGERLDEARAVKLGLRAKAHYDLAAWAADWAPPAGRALGESNGGVRGGLGRGVGSSSISDAENEGASLRVARRRGRRVSSGAVRWSGGAEETQSRVSSVRQWNFFHVGKCAGSSVSKVRIL